MLTNPLKTRIFPAAALALTLAAGAGPAWAATTGTITLSATVPSATAIVVTGITGYNSLDLSSSATDLAVADVREVNNTTGGYTVSVSSSNSSALKNGTLGSVPYTAKYNGATVALSSTPTLVTTGVASNSVVNVVKQVKISYAGQSSGSIMAGTYTDTLTFTIAAQ